MHMDSDIIYHYLISEVITFSIGLMIFHNEHTFNPPYVATTKKWNKKDSGLLGSSFIQVPNYLSFFTVGIEYHHIHHMYPSIPGYNLHRFHEELKKNTNELDNIIELSMNDCYKNLWLTLYDEDNDRYISFKEADPIAQEEFFLIYFSKISRFLLDSFFESFNFFLFIFLFKTTAAAYTGPIKLPLPTSSTPAIIFFIK